jgi:transposase
MRGRKSPQIVAHTEEEHYELRRWVRTANMPSGLVRRARAILLVFEGMSITETGRIVGMGRRIVRFWVSRFTTKGIEGLKDKPGRGRKPPSSP